MADLRSRLCKYLTVNIDYFGSLFQEEFVPKEINMYDYIGKQVRSTMVPDHNAVFALSKMLKESFFIIGVRHNWKSANSPRNFTPSQHIMGFSLTMMFEQGHFVN